MQMAARHPQGWAPRYSQDNLQSKESFLWRLNPSLALGRAPSPTQGHAVPQRTRRLAGRGSFPLALHQTRGTLGR